MNGHPTDTPYRQGLDAGFKGIMPCPNPYPEAQAEWFQWARGYNTGLAKRRFIAGTNMDKGE
jgi:hypothetical protein